MNYVEQQKVFSEIDVICRIARKFEAQLDTMNRCLFASKMEQLDNNYLAETLINVLIKIGPLVQLLGINQEDVVNKVYPPCTDEKEEVLT
jgi:hypothetical protein